MGLAEPVERVRFIQDTAQHSARQAGLAEIGGRTRRTVAKVSDCTTSDCRLACAILVDSRGWLLLQERDEHAPVDANKWGLVGGHCDQDESYADAVVREVMEESELDVLTDPRIRGWQLWWTGDLLVANKTQPHLRDTWQVWVGRADLTDADIRCHEGRQIVFVDPQRLDHLQLGHGPSVLVPQFLRSTTYSALRRGNPIPSGGV